MIKRISLVGLLLLFGCNNERVNSKVVNGLIDRGYNNIEIVENTISPMCDITDVYQYNVIAVKNGKHVKLVVCQLDQINSVHLVQKFKSVNTLK